MTTLSKKALFVIIYFLVSSISCVRQGDQHYGFTSHSECYVSTDDVLTEKFPFGEVDRIDTTKASGCAREQLKNTYLLYVDTQCVAVYNQHPKENIELINHFIKKYQTDSTCLYDFVKFDSICRITISRLCKIPADKHHFGDYVEWRCIEYSTITKPYFKIKDEVLNTFVKWKE